MNDQPHRLVLALVVAASGFVLVSLATAIPARAAVDADCAAISAGTTAIDC